MVRRFERGDMRVKLVITAFAILLALTGCTRPPTASPSAPVERFRLVVTPDGKALRLDSQTGEVASVTEKGVKTLPVNERVRLEVGQIYVTETGELVAYKGELKFGSADEALLRKYLPEKKAP